MSLERASCACPPVKHGVKRRDLVHAHLGHLEQLGDGVHAADTRPALVLPLAEVEHGDHCGLFVLGRVVRDDFLRLFQVVGGECKGDRGVVVVGVAVLRGSRGGSEWISGATLRHAGPRGSRTTKIASERLAALLPNARRTGPARAEVRAVRAVRAPAAVAMRMRVDAAALDMVCGCSVCCDAMRCDALCECRPCERRAAGGGCVILTLSRASRGHRRSGTRWGAAQIAQGASAQVEDTLYRAAVRR